MFRPVQRRGLIFLTVAFFWALSFAPAALGVARVEPSKFLFTLQPGGPDHRRH